MATFSEIYFNGSEYTQMWFNGSKIWEKDNGGFPYSVDSVVTYVNTSTYSQNATFTVIDNSLPYSINGVTTTSYTFYNGETQVKLVNLKPTANNVGDSFLLINVEQLRIPKATDLSALFYYFGCNANYTYLWSPQYFEFNENPTNMNSMFFYCQYLTDELMNQFMPYFPNTSKVTDMGSMFSSCSKLTSLDLSNFDTSLVTNMGYMFGGCFRLTSLDISSFNTSKVTDMGDMFTGCTSLTSLDVSSFNTSNVTDMSYMFNNCTSLASLDLSNFDTSNVTNMGLMFDRCSSLTSLNLSSFDTSNVTSVRYMFRNCSSLTSLDLSSWDTSKVTNTSDMFDGVKNCTIYIGDKWTLSTSSTFGGGSGLKFVRINPITSITLESTLTDTTITRGTQFTITPTVVPSNHTDELVITYDTNALFMTDNIFTVLDDVPIGESLSITYSSKLKPSISATYTITIRDYINIASITLQHTLDSLIIEPNTTFTITPITTPTLHEDELLVEFDDTYITHNDGMFTITNAPYSENMSITYYSKANPSVNATLNLMVRDFIPITSITLEHTLDSLVIEPNTMFTITPVIVPTVNDDEVMIEFDDTYMAYNDGVFTVTNAPFNEPLSIKYSSKFDSTVYATLDLTVRDFIPITSITLEHTLETLVDVMVGTTFSIVPNVMPTLHDDELLVDYDTSYLSMENNTFTVLSGASEQTVQIIYYSKYNNSVYGMIEFTVAKEEEVQETVLTYNTFEKVANIATYLTYTTDETENTITMECNTKTSSKYTSNLWVQLDTPLPKKCRIKITGISNASIPSSMVSQGYPNNQLFAISNNSTFLYDTINVMPSNGIVYIEGVRTQIESYEGASKIGLFQTNPSLMYMGSNSYSYPFEFETDYDFNFEPYLYLFCSVHYGGSSGALLTSSYVTYKDLQVEVRIKHCNTINLTSDIEDLTNVNQSSFTITPVTFPADAGEELIVTYDSNYLTTNDNRTFTLKQGCQGQTLSITYTGMFSNVSKTITFTVSEDVEFIETLIDFTQSTAPTLPDYMTVDKNNTYSFSHGTYTTNVYGLIPNNKGKKSTTAYTRYKYVAPKSGDLTFTYRCYAETSYDYLTVHVNTSTSQPSTTSATNQVFTTKGVSSYQNTDGTASVSVVEGTTYYIHIQYYKDSSGDNGYDMGCIRKIDLI